MLHPGDVFEFYAENTHYERIVVGGNPGSTTIELIGLTGYVHHNLTVDGDIHNLLVNGSIGTDNDTPSKFPQNAGNEPAAAPYKSGLWRDRPSPFN